MLGSNPESALRIDIAAYSRDPLGFVQYAYPWGKRGRSLEDASGPHIWQADMLRLIGDHLQSASWATPLLIAVASGHGIGKSANIGQIIHWGMSTCEDCRVIVTANTGDQLKTKTIPEVGKWFRLGINAHWFDVGTETIKIVDKVHAKNWRCDFLTWSLEKPESFAGLHNRGKRIIIVFDESSAIPPEIWEVVEGALTDEDTEIIFVAYGNPTQNTGRFRECFGRNKHRWITRQIDSRTVEGTNKEQIAKWISDYGEDSDFVRIRVRGEFPRAGSSQFIPSDVVEAARKRDAGDQDRAHKILSCDVARFGNNQTVIGWRQGLRAKITDKMRGKDTIDTGKQVIFRIVTERPRSVVIDGDGIGGGVVDYVRAYLPEVWKAAGLPCEMQKDKTIKLPDWFKLEEFHGGMAPGDSFMYFNKRAEVWGKMRDWLATGEIPDDPELADELVGPEYYHSNKNQIQLEKKEDMEARGLSSPDNGDMLAMTFGVTPTPKTRDEALLEEIQATADPLERHFKRLQETERREKARQPLQFWE